MCVSLYIPMGYGSFVMDKRVDRRYNGSMACDLLVCLIRYFIKQLLL